MTEPLERFSTSKIIFIALLLFLSQFKLFSQIYPDSSVHKILKSGIQLIADQKYDDAFKLFKTLDESRKDLPLGKIYLAATMIAEAYDYQQPFDDKSITKYLDDAKKIIERLLDGDDKYIWNNYFYALTTGYSAYYDALSDNWISAFSTGINSVAAFEYCLSIDEKFYESLIAIGNFKFWKSKKTEYFNWLPFFPDEKDSGIAYLEKAVTHSRYNSYLAIHSLIWIYIEQGEYQKAIKIAETGLLKNPGSRLFKWGLARAYENVNPEKSISIYFDILKSYPSNIKSNKINEITLKHIIAQQYVKLGKFDEALKLCNEILSVNNLNDFEHKKLDERIERVMQLRNQLKSK